MSRYLIAADPLSTFLPATDTTTLLAHELCRRGHAVDYLDLSLMDWQLSPERYLSSLRVSAIQGVTLHDRLPFDLSESRLGHLSDYRVILHRKDPPVDDMFLGHCRAFGAAPVSILQVNDPRFLGTVSEHELPMQFAELSIPTRVVTSPGDLESIVHFAAGELVAKPRNTYSGWGIEFFSRNASVDELHAYWSRWQTAGGVIIQDYAPEIETIGDVRILMMNGLVIGSVLRRPKPGSRLANLHQGATAHPWMITAQQRVACETVASALKEKGLYLLGLDFIGDRISEINVTCPSALPQINAVENIEGQITIIDEIEKMSCLR